MKKVIAISGSHRLGGNTEFALNKVLEFIKDDDIATELVTLSDKPINPCCACDTCRKTKICRINDGFQEIYMKIEKADGLIFGCPVYTFAPPPKFLSFRTRLSRIAHCRGEKNYYSSTEDYIKAYPHYSALRRKLGGTIVVARRGGADIVLSQINTFFLAHEMFLVGSGYLNIVYGYKKGEIEQDEEGIKNILRFADNFKWLIRKL